MYSHLINKVTIDYDKIKSSTEMIVNPGEYYKNQALVEM